MTNRVAILIGEMEESRQEKPRTTAAVIISYSPKNNLHSKLIITIIMRYMCYNNSRNNSYNNIKILTATFPLLA